MVTVPVPQVTYKHAYVVTESIPGMEKAPNCRDHDGSIYFKRQGNTLQIGGYESNPIYLDIVRNIYVLCSIGFEILLVLH